MRIIGAHSILYSRNAEADRAFLRDVLGLPGVDVGGGWLIFGLPPSEVAVHPSEKNDVHEFYLMCDDVAAFVARMDERGVRCDPVQNMGWGVLTRVTLPAGGKVGVYQPRPPGQSRCAPEGRRRSVRAPPPERSGSRRPRAGAGPGSSRI
jgi:catechol 2,3-dioxygenase-like lactoylglutathione lyase family enzyme